MGEFGDLFAEYVLSLETRKQMEDRYSGEGQEAGRYIGSGVIRPPRGNAGHDDWGC